MNQAETRDVLKTLFNPRNITIIGASADVSKWGNIIPGNIIGGGYKGRIYLVNPKNDFVHGIKVFRTVGEIDDDLDLVMLAIPASGAEDAVRECGERGCRAMIIIAGGFSEADTEGATHEKRVVELARSYGIRVVGPNTMGIYSSPLSLSALMPPVRPKPGHIAFASQSGNLGTQMLGWGSRRNIGFSRFVCIGNESDLGFRDYLDYFRHDPETGVILLYVEGFKDPRGFMEAARGAAAEKPIVMYKAGGTQAGRKAASSHSAALAGTQEIYEGFMHQMGMLTAETTEEMLDFSDALVKLPLPAGNRIGIVTWGGGWGVVTADLCERQGMQLTPLSPTSMEQLGRILPSYWSKGNPVDLVGLFDLDAHMECVEIMAADDSFDGVISLGSINANAWVKQMIEREWAGMSDEEKSAALERINSMAGVFIKKVADLIDKYGKPIVTVGMPQQAESAQEVPGQERLCMYSQPESAVRVMSMLCRRAAFLKGIS
ncbi:MAG: CoA-binding protein [Actinobacteria bacterium]|nr:CoA-binding protein [Actinomycetota bacterium]